MVLEKGSNTSNIHVQWLIDQQIEPLPPEVWNWQQGRGNFGFAEKEVALRHIYMGGAVCCWVLKLKLKTFWL